MAKTDEIDRTDATEPPPVYEERYLALVDIMGCGQVFDQIDEILSRDDSHCMIPGRFQEMWRGNSARLCDDDNRLHPRNV